MFVMMMMGLVFIVLLALGIPVAATLGLTGMLFVYLLDPVYISGIGHAVWNNTSSEILVCIPLFILMGELIQQTGIASRFYTAMAQWMKWMPGGLLCANLGASAIFSAVSGTSVATAATIGKAAIPSLLKAKYDKRMTFGSLAAGGTLGILIPPSLPLIIYGSMTDVSIGKLFLAAIVPGLLVVSLFIAYIAFMALVKPSIAPKNDDLKVTALSLSLAFLQMLPLLIIIGVILGAVYSGFATTTEAAALSVLIVLITAVIQKKLTWTIIRTSLISSVQLTAMIMFIIVGAQIFSFAVFSWGISAELAEWVSGLPYPSIVILLAIILFYLILGMFVDSVSIMVMSLAIIFPIIVELNYDPIWFGVILVILLEIGLIHPPVGMNLFVIQAIDPKNIDMKEVAMGSLPFVVLLLIAIGILIAYPQIALWLPSQT